MAGRTCSDALARQPDDASAGRPTLASDPALVYYTSGTTGPPKAVLHDHGYTWTQRYTSRFWHGVREGERLWTTSDTGWAKAAYGVIFGPWSEGAEVVLYHGRFEPRAELAFLAEIAPHVFCAPPTEFRLLVKEDLTRFAVPRLRECVSAGEPLNPEVIRAWREATGITIRDGYGQTETILLVGNYPGQAVRPGAMGLPMPGIRVEVIDERGEPMPPGEVGDIAVHGQPPGLSREYWKDPARHRARAPRRLVSHRRPRLARPGRLLLVRRARRRRDHLGRLPDRTVRGRERADRAPRRGRGRRGGRARPRPRTRS